MDKTKTHILVVEDEPAHIAMIRRSLAGDDTVSLQFARTLEDYRILTADTIPDIVLLDLNLPDGSALDLLGDTRLSSCPVLVMTSHGSESVAVQTLKRGAVDYLVKSPETFATLPKTIVRCLREWQVQQEHGRAIDALRESELRFRTLLQDVETVAVQGCLPDGTIVYWNRASEDLYGYRADEALAQNLFELVVPSSLQDQVRQEFSSMITSGQSIPATERLRQHKNGTAVEVYSNYALVSLAGGSAEIYSVEIDITERKRNEQQLFKLVQAVEQSPAAVVITDLQGQIEYVNPKFSEITCYSSSEAIGQNPRIIQSGQTDSSVYEQIWTRLLAGKEWKGEILNKHKNGHLLWEHAQISPLRDTAGDITHYIGIKEDISVQKKYEQQLERQATHDPLTGLANRILLKDRLEQAIQHTLRSGLTVAVLLLDLDRFKIINDSLGHAFGDDLLCQVAQRLREIVRECDTIARFGGDEFVVVLTEVASPDVVAKIAAKILSTLNRPFHLSSRDVTLTASLGISLAPTDSCDGATLIRYADIAMYQSKRRRSEYSFFTEEMNRHLLTTLELESALRQALENKEFRLFYQPKVDLKTGRIDSCEALLRWQHPQRGMVSPGQFIPLAEETGLIVPIGIWVLEEACRQNLSWQQRGIAPIQTAVNISARQFRQGDVVEIVSRTLERSGLDPALLDLELTESMVMDNPHAAHDTLHELKRLGVDLSLDDFGTGYSSLNYLRRFPVDNLKIDQSFINDVADDESAASVATSIIAIAHSLKMRAIAEGVETPEQLDFLMSRDCDAMQGYLFSRPLPAEAFSDLIKEGKRLNI